MNETDATKKARMVPPPESPRRDLIHERLLRPIAAEMDWGRQWGMWEVVRGAPSDTIKSKEDGN